MAYQRRDVIYKGEFRKTLFEDYKKISEPMSKTLFRDYKIVSLLVLHDHQVFGMW